MKKEENLLKKEFNTAKGILKNQIAISTLIRNGEIFKLLDKTLDLLCIYEIETSHLVYVSDSWINVFGYNREEIYGKSLFDFIHPEDINKTNQLLKSNNLNDTEICILENRIQHIHGSFVNVQWNVLHNEISNNVNGYSILIGRPIFDIKKLEENKIPSRIQTVFKNGDIQDVMTVGIDWVTVSEGMICRDIAPESLIMSLWQCLLIPNVGKSMDWHKHPQQIERLLIFRGVLNLEIQVYSFLQLLGLKSKDKIIYSKKVKLKVGDKYVISPKKWHKILTSEEGCNYTIEWKPRNF